jgi:hypothetical protein
MAATEEAPPRSLKSEVEPAQHAVAALLKLAESFPAAVPAALPSCAKIVSACWRTICARFIMDVRMRTPTATLVGMQKYYLTNGLLPPVQLEALADDPTSPRAETYVFHHLLPGGVVVKLQLGRTMRVTLSTGQQCHVQYTVWADYKGLVNTLGREVCAALLPYMYLRYTATFERAGHEPKWSRLAALVSDAGAAQRALVLGLVGDVTLSQARAVLVAARASGGPDMLAPTCAWAPISLYAWCVKALRPAVRWSVMVATKPPPGAELDTVMQFLLDRKVVARSQIGQDSWVAEGACPTKPFSRFASAAVRAARNAAWSPGRAAWTRAVLSS